jgi:hypothetical protein
MRKWIAVCSLLGLISITSCAATWTLSWHSPTQDDTGTCAAPVLIPTVGGLVRHALTRNGIPITVPMSQPGALNTLAQSGASGIYTYIISEVDSVGNVSCPDTLTVLVRGKYATVTDLKVN